MDISSLKPALLLSFLLTTLPSAQANTPHTWHTITTHQASWKGTLQTTNEIASFVDADGKPLSTFILTGENPVKFGFDYDTKKDDFDVAYTLTLTKQTTTSFVSPTCVFVVTAKGPADPDVRYFSYNGAICSVKIIPGIGENFFAL